MRWTPWRIAAAMLASLALFIAVGLGATGARAILFGPQVQNGWVYYHPSPLKHSHLRVTQGRHLNGGCDFTSRLNAGQAEQQVAVNLTTCEAIVEVGEASSKAETPVAGSNH